MSIVNRHSLPRAQRGVALLVVLVVLVIVTLMGVVAMRSGMLQVAIATNSQVNGLLFQNADSGVESVRALIEADPQEAAQPSGVVGIASAQLNDEVVGCMTKNALVMGTSHTAPRRCDPDTGTDYFSARGVAQVQVAVSAVLDATGQPLEVITYGQEQCHTKECQEGGQPLSAERAIVAVHSTSVMPTFGGATASEVEGCLTGYKMSRGSYTVTDCLTDANASFRTVVHEMAFGISGYGNNSSSTTP